VRAGTQGGAKVGFGPEGGAVLAVAFEQDPGAGAGGCGLAAAQPGGELDGG
jgi:hypothetical protein